MLDYLEMKPGSEPFPYSLHGGLVVQCADMIVDEAHVEEDKHQEAELEVVLHSHEEIVLGTKPCKEEEVVVEVAEEVV